MDEGGEAELTDDPIHFIQSKVGKIPTIISAPVGGGRDVSGCTASRQDLHQVAFHSRFTETASSQVIDSLGKQ